MIYRVAFRVRSYCARRRVPLQQVYREGSAYFVAELISGRHISDLVHEWALPREREIWQRFAKFRTGSNRAGFLYGGERPEGWPTDVGYFVGYRIAEAYYKQTNDKRQALADILTTTDVEVLLDQSGYAERFGSAADYSADVQRPVAYGFSRSASHAAKRSSRARSWAVAAR